MSATSSFVEVGRSFHAPKYWSKCDTVAILDRGFFGSTSNFRNFFLVVFIGTPYCTYAVDFINMVPLCRQKEAGTYFIRQISMTILGDGRKNHELRD